MPISLAAVLLFSACGSEDSESAATAPTETPNNEPAATNLPTIESTDTDPPATETPAPERLMFDATCMDLQLAQDTVQAELNIFFSSSEDATGRDRMQVLDRNWIVLDQTPPPGSPVTDDAEISFIVVKDDEVSPGDC